MINYIFNSTSLKMRSIKYYYAVNDNITDTSYVKCTCDVLLSVTRDWKDGLGASTFLNPAPRERWCERVERPERNIASDALPTAFPRFGDAFSDGGCPLKRRATTAARRCERTRNAAIDVGPVRVLATRLISRGHSSRTEIVLFGAN